MGQLCQMFSALQVAETLLLGEVQTRQGLQSVHVVVAALHKGLDLMLVNSQFNRDVARPAVFK